MAVSPSLGVHYNVSPVSRSSVSVVAYLLRRSSYIQSITKLHAIRTMAVREYGGVAV